MINWGALGLVGIVSFAAAVAVVVLVSFALVGLSARETVPEGADGPGSDVTVGGMSPAVGTTIAAVCLLAVAVIVLYGLYIIVA